MKRLGPGHYNTDDGRYTIQCPHLMDASDADRQWYLMDMVNRDNVWGPYDTKREAVAALASLTAK